MRAGQGEPVRWYDIVFLSLILYLILAPAGTNQILLPMLGLAVAAGLLRMLTTLGRRDESILTLPLLAGLCAVPMIAVGLLRGNPGAYDVAVPMVLGPIAWFVICHLPGRATLRLLPAVIMLGSFVTSIAVLFTLVGIELPIISFLNQTERGVLINGRSRVNLTSATSLIATIPTLVALYFQRDLLTGWTRRFLPIALITGLTALLIAGRQSLIGVVLILPILTLVLGRLGFRIQRDEHDSQRIDRWIRSFLVGVVGLLAAGILAAGFGVNVAAIPNRAFAAVGIGQADSISGENSLRTRTTQNSVLLGKFWERPVIGHGAGPVFDELSARHRVGNRDRPWRLELHYHLLLAEGGLMIVFLYVMLAVRARRLLSKVHLATDGFESAVMFSVIIGAGGLLVASAANPYLRAVGQQWTLFLPVAVAALVVPAVVRSRSSGGSSE